jgi:hypothetical protein
VRGGYVPLLFSEQAVDDATDVIITLRPTGRQR